MGRDETDQGKSGDAGRTHTAGTGQGRRDRTNANDIFSPHRQICMLQDTKQICISDPIHASDTRCPVYGTDALPPRRFSPSTFSTLPPKLRPESTS